MTSHRNYDELAPHYQEYSQLRSRSIEAVDAFILRNAPPVRRLLDVGAADGQRGRRLAAGLGAAELVLCEPSPRMAALCRHQGGAEVWECAVPDLPASAPFEVILCLWNVLGHLEHRQARIQGLTRMRQLLAPGGAIFLDVNNRHNALAYGRLKVIWRRLRDYLSPDEQRGDASFTWNIGGKTIQGKGHLFTPSEVSSLFEAAGLRMTRRVAVDYSNGACSDSAFEGQLVFMLSAAP